MIYNFNSTQKRQKSKPKIEKPAKLTVFLYPGGEVKIYPAFMDDQEERKARPFLEFLKTYKRKGGER